MTLKKTIRLSVKKIFSWVENIFLYIIKPKAGTTGWLVQKEYFYGGYVTEIKRNVVSDKDLRSNDEINRGGMTGGDRMSGLYHGYGKYYSQYIKDFLDSEKIVLVEIGVLKGTGVAIWSDLFPDGRVIGLDIDISNVDIENLKSKGAFSNNNMELLEFDQYKDNQGYLADILGGQKISICIDDGIHSNQGILNTIESVKVHLADRFVYFIEDNEEVYYLIKNKYPHWVVKKHGQMTVITN